MIRKNDITWQFQQNQSLMLLIFIIVLSEAFHFIFHFSPSIILHLRLLFLDQALPGTLLAIVKKFADIFLKVLIRKINSSKMKYESVGWTLRV